MGDENLVCGRRAFVGGVLATGVAVGFGDGRLIGKAESSPTATHSGRVGISDAAYSRAWKRAAAYVARMTLAEKVGQVNNPGGQGPCNGTDGVPAIPRLTLAF